LDVDKSDVEVTAGLAERVLRKTGGKDFGFVSVEGSFRFGHFVTGLFGVVDKV
jgi:hypothetical protein